MFGVTGKQFTSIYHIRGVHLYLPHIINNNCINKSQQFIIWSVIKNMNGDAYNTVEQIQ